MSLAVFTALVGLAIAPGHLDPLRAFLTVLAIAAGAGAAGVLNMRYDADIDVAMARTARRPIPCGRVSRSEALVFGLALAGSAVAVLALAANVKAAALLAFAIFFYVVVYTIWLKRSTPHNIVIGGAAVALPPVIGWAAATADIGLEPLVLFLIVFLWTPPHFWALSLNRAEEYAPRGRPHAAGRRRKSCNNPADFHIQRASAGGLDAAVGVRVCRNDLRHRCCGLWSDPRCARGSTEQGPCGRPAQRSSHVRVLHRVPVRRVCGVVDR
jgi:hypothetical protein